LGDWNQVKKELDQAKLKNGGKLPRLKVRFLDGDPKSVSSHFPLKKQRKN